MAQKAAAGANRMRDYEVFEHIGSGASGDVYRVVYKATSRTYVMKKMSLANMSDEEQLRAKQEIIAMDEVDHPNVVKFRESFSDPVDNSVDIIMEYCECGTLEGLIERQRYEGKPFPTDVLLEWMAELLCGLAHIHSKRILHRDIKTGNIFVTSKNHLKLGDFGVCTILAFPNSKAESMIGTPLYFAPEVCNNDLYDERSDVWSLGVVFYEMCTLRRPFEGENLFSLIQQILDSDIPSFNNGIPSELEGLVMLMLDRDPMRRPTAQELIDIHLEVPPSHPSHPSQKPSMGRRLQMFSGPELTYTKLWPPPDGSAPPLTAPRKTNVTSADWIHTGSAMATLHDLQRTTHGIKSGAAAPTTATTNISTSSTSAPAAKSKAIMNDSKMSITKTTVKTPPSSSLASVSRSATLSRPADERLSASNASITMRDLHADIQRRRSQLFGEEVKLDTEYAPVVIELQGTSFAQALETVRSSRGLSETRSSGVEEFTVKESSSFLVDIAAVLDKHTANGKQVELEHLDGAVGLLTQYKFLNYGLK